MVDNQIDPAEVFQLLKYKNCIPSLHLQFFFRSVMTGLILRIMKTSNESPIFVQSNENVHVKLTRIRWSYSPFTNNAKCT